MVILFQDTAKSFLKAVLLQRIHQVPILPEKMHASYDSGVQCIRTNRFSLDKLMANLKLKISAHSASFQRFIRDLDFLLLHESDKKYFVAQKAIEFSLKYSFKKLFQKDNALSVQYYRYCQSVKAEHALSLKIKPRQCSDGTLFLKADLRHNIQDLILHSFKKMFYFDKLVIFINDQVLLLHKGQTLNVPIKVSSIENELIFDSLWHNYLAKALCMPQAHYQKKAA